MRTRSTFTAAFAALLLASSFAASAQNEVISACNTAVTNRDLTLIGTGEPIPSGPSQFRVPMTVSRGDGAVEIICRYDGRVRRATLEGLSGVPQRDVRGAAGTACAASAQLRGFNVAAVASVRQWDPDTWRVVLRVAGNDPPTIECTYSRDGQAVVDALPQAS